MNAPAENVAPDAPAQSLELVVVQTAITNMSRVDAGLAELRRKFSGVIFAVGTDEGMKAAKAARREIAAPRIEVEKIRKEAKAPILALGRKLDSEAARITAELQKIEGPIDQQITAEENRIRAELEAKERAELERVGAIRQRIADIRGAIQTAALCKTSEQVQRHLDDLIGISIDDSFAEFAEEAARALNESILNLRSLCGVLREREAEAQRLAEERAELDRRAAEQAERDRQAAERAENERRRVAGIQERIAELRGCQTLTASSGSALIAEHISDLDNLFVDPHGHLKGELFSEYLQQAVDAKAAGLARLRALHTAALAHEAEQARLKQEREAFEAQQRAASERQEAEDRRIAQERAELEALQRAEREAQEARELAEREAQEKREREAEEERQRNFVPTLDQLADVIAIHYGCSTEKATDWMIQCVREWNGRYQGLQS